MVNYASVYLKSIKQLYLTAERHDWPVRSVFLTFTREPVNKCALYIAGKCVHVNETG